MTQFFKGTFKYLFLLTTFVTLFSCSSDDDDDTPEWNDIAGNYSGWTKGVFSYSPTGIVTDNETVAVTVNTDGTVDLKLTSATWGETTVTGAVVSASGKDYAVSGTSTTKMGMQGSEAKEYAGTVSGKISKDKSSVTLTVSCPSVMGGTTITFTSGSAPVAELVAGTYEGWSKAVFTYNPAGMTTDGEEVTITANEDGTVNISYVSSTWGEFTINNATISKDADGYTFEGEGVTVMGMTEESKKEYPCLVSGTIGTDKATYSIEFSVPSVMGGLTITFANGSAPATVE